MDLSVIAPPLVEPITPAEAMVELRLITSADDIDEDDLDYQSILAKIQAARQYCENETGRAFVRQTLRLSGFDLSACRGRASIFSLLRPPVLSIDAVTYIDADGDEQTVEPDSYYVVPSDTPRFYFISGYSLPTMHERPDAFRIDYVAGYPPGEPPEDFDPDSDPPQHLAANVPGPLKEAIKFTLRLMYLDMTPADRAATENARDQMLWHYKVLKVA